MKKILIMTASVMLCAFVFTGRYAASEPPGGERPFFEDEELKGDNARRPHAPGPEKMEDVRKRIELIRMWRLTEELNLDEATAARLFPVIAKHDKERMQIEREAFQIMREMRRHEQTPDENASKETLKKLEENRSAMDSLRQRQNEEIKKILKPSEMVKYIMFEEKFSREMREIAEDVRRERRGPYPGHDKGPEKPQERELPQR